MSWDQQGSGWESCAADLLKLGPLQVGSGRSLWSWPAWEFYMHFVKTEFYLPFLCFVKNKIPVDLKV